MPCCVPGCSNLLEEWTTNLPCDDTLLRRWKAAIQAGTGQCLADESFHGGAKICDMHFADKHIDGGKEDYREPSLFVRNKTLFHVVSCRLCLKYGTIDNMFDKDSHVAQNSSLHSLASKYFGLLKSPKERTEEGYFCEMCVVRIDMTHTFWQEMIDGAKEHKKLLQRMAKEKVVFRTTGTGHEEDLTLTGTSMVRVYFQGEASGTESENFESKTSDCIKRENLSPASADLVIEEEPQLIECNLSHSANLNKCTSPTQKGQEVTLNGIESETDTDQSYKHKVVVPLSDSVVIKEEPQLTQSDPPQIPAELKQRFIFKCYVCNTTFENKKSLIHHLMIDHKPQESYICNTCNTTFDKLISFNIHLSTHQDATKSFKCKLCTKTFTRKDTLLRHEVTLHGKDSGEPMKPSKKWKKHVCKTCGKAYFNKAELERHEMLQHQGKTFIHCNICERPLSSFRNLQMHLKTHRNDDKIIQCKFCDATYGKQRDMLNHVMGKHITEYRARETRSKVTSSTKQVKLVSFIGVRENRTTKCNLCETSFKLSKEVVTHFQEAHPATELKYHPCGSCDEVFFLKKSLTKHSYMHTGKYGCDQCGKPHYSALALGIHKQTVHDIPLDTEHTVRCPICEQVLVRGTNYSDHMQTHEEVKPFGCVFCDKTFRRKYHLLIHERIHTGEKPFSCDSCDKGFRDSGKLRIHRRTHTGEKPLACPYCEVRFADPSSFYKHRRLCMKNAQLEFGTSSEYVSLDNL